MGVKRDDAAMQSTMPRLFWRWFDALSMTTLLPARLIGRGARRPCISHCSLVRDSGTHSLVSLAASLRDVGKRRILWCRRDIIRAIAVKISCSCAPTLVKTNRAWPARDAAAMLTAVCVLRFRSPFVSSTST